MVTEVNVTKVKRAGRTTKCHMCEEDIDKTIDIKHKNKWYHSSCLDNLLKAEEEKITKEMQDKQELYDYICKLYNLKTITPKIDNQIKNFIEIKKYKYSGIMLSLKYFYETLDNPILEEAGIGIVPYVYEEAKKQYILFLEAKTHTETINEPYVTTKEIRIQVPNCKPLWELIDMDTLLEGTEEAIETKDEESKNNLIDMDNL